MEHYYQFFPFSQGFVITLPYCFLNTEVRNVLKHNLHRWQANRNWNRGGGGGAAGLGGAGGYPRPGNASARKNCHEVSNKREKESRLDCSLVH